MRYISLDLETAGPDPRRHAVLELAAVVEDSRRPLPLPELPAFRRLLRHPEIAGTAGALALNVRLLREMADAPTGPDAPADHCEPAEVLAQLREFLLAQGFKTDAKGWVKGKQDGKDIFVCDSCNKDDNLACDGGAMKLWDGPPVKSTHPNPDGTFG